MIVSSIQDMYFCLSETDQLSDIQIVVNIDALAEIFFQNVFIDILKRTVKEVSQLCSVNH